MSYPSDRPISLRAKSQDGSSETSPDRSQDERLESDPNLQAFLREKKSLTKKHRNCLVAYSEGSRVAIGHSAQDLMDQIPKDFQNQPLFIKELLAEPVRLRRPRRVFLD